MAYQPLINRCSNVCLDIHRPTIAYNGSHAHQWRYKQTPNQHWEFVDAGGGWYWLRNEESGKSLDIHRPHIGANGAHAHQWDYQGTPNQQWQPVDAGNGWFWLRNRESGKSLDVAVYDIAKRGARIQQWDYNTTSNQQWRWGGNTNENRFVFGAFEFDPDIYPADVTAAFEQHRRIVSVFPSCNSLETAWKERLTVRYAWPIRHSTTADAVGGYAILNERRIWVNFARVLHYGTSNLARVLIHEMMHCAGFAHPQLTPADVPGDNGPYYSSPPVLAERCTAPLQLMLESPIVCTPEGDRFTLG